MKLYFHDFCLIFDDDFATDNQKKRKERKKERKKEKREGGVSLCVRHKERERGRERKTSLFHLRWMLCFVGTNTLIIIIERTDNCFLFHISFSFFAYNTKHVPSPRFTRISCSIVFFSGISILI